MRFLLVGLKLLMALSLFLGLLTSEPQSALALIPSQVYEQVKDSVVVVRAYDRAGKAVGLGSGMTLPGGDIVTSHHVIAQGTRFTVSQRGKAVPATLKADDPEKDLALLRAPGLMAQPARLGRAGSLKVFFLVPRLPLGNLNKSGALLCSDLWVNSH